MIDMVVINLYRFEDTVAKEGCTLEEAIENIDIGGPTMVRSAAKNYRFVSIVTDPDDYPKLIEEMKKTGGEVSEKTNFMLSTKAFQLTARYDAAISNWLGTIQPRGRKEGLPRCLHPAVPEGPGPALRREPPSEGRLLPRGGRSCCPGSQAAGSSRARNSPTTTSWTATPPGRWPAISSCPRRSS